MKRIAFGILSFCLVMVIGYYLFVVVVTVFKFGEPPSWTYGEGKFTRFKHVVRSAELESLLRNEQPEEFNRRRRALGFGDRYINLKGLFLVGKDLPGVDLSKCVLTGCNFAGCDLRGASFIKSYLAQTTFCGPLSVQSGAITPKMARITDVTGSHFDGATFKATVYFWVEKARGLRHLVSDSVVWVRDEAEFDNTSVGHPIILSDLGRAFWAGRFLARFIHGPKRETGESGSSQESPSKRLQKCSDTRTHSTRNQPARSLVLTQLLAKQKLASF